MREEFQRTHGVCESQKLKTWTGVDQPRSVTLSFELIDPYEVEANASGRVPVD